MLDDSEARSSLLNERTRKLTSKLALKNSDNSILVKAFSNLQNDRSQLRENIEFLRLKTQQTERLNAELEDKNIKLGNHLNQSTEDRKGTTELEALNDTLKDKNTDLISDYSDLQSQIKSIDQSNKQNVQQTQQLVAQNETFQSELTEANKEVLRLKEINSKYQQEDEDTVDEIQQLKSKIEKIEANNKTLASELEQFKEAKNEYQSLHTKIATLSSARDQLIKDLDKSTSTHFSDTNLLKTQKDQIKALDSDAIKLNNESKQSTQDLSKLKSKLQTLEADKKELYAELQTAQQETSSISELKKKLAEQQETIDSDRSSLEDEIKRHEDYLMKSETRWASEAKNLRDSLESSKRIHAEANKKTTVKTKKLSDKLLTLTSERNKLAEEKANEIKTLQNKLTALNTKMHSVQKPDKPTKHTKQINGNTVRYPIEAIEGIGVVYGKRFRNININFVDTLLNKGKNTVGRKSLTERTDINKDLILTWVNHADLFRIKGVEGNYAELLEASGVDTVKALRNRNATNLTVKMKTTNKEKRLAPQAPEEHEVKDWILQADYLDPVFTSDNSTPSSSQMVKKATRISDDLTKIKGIGKVNERRLHSLGIKTFSQIATFTKQDEKNYGAKLSSFHERITKEGWVKQANELHKVKYGKNI
ncbi:MAG: DUF4332 domain-containing protein [Thiotrichaceae bacterium]